MKDFIKKISEIKALDFNVKVTHEDLRCVIYYVYCLVVFLSPVIPEAIGYGIYSLKNTLFILLTFLSVMFLVILDIIEKKKIKLNAFEILLIIYGVITFISAFFSDYGFVKCMLGTNGRGEGVITILSYVAAFVIGTRLFNERKNVLIILIVSIIVASIYGILQANNTNNIKFFFGTASDVAKSTFGNPNFFSSYLCLVLPMACYYFINTDKKIKWLYFLSAIFGFSGLVYSKTLGGYLTFIGMLILLSVFSLIYTTSRKNVMVKTLMLFVIFVILFLGISHTKQNSYISEIKETTTEVKKLANNDRSFGTGRMEIWQKTLSVINNNKLLGVGPDSLTKELKIKNYITNGEDDVLNKYIIDKAHSEPLQIAATTGIISLVLYTFFITSYLLALSKIVINKNKSYIINNENFEDKYKIQYITAILIGVLGYLIQALVNISVVEVAPIFWMVLGLGNGAIIKENKK